MIDQLRRHVVKELLAPRTVAASWPRWRQAVRHLCRDGYTAATVLDLGDHLSSIFRVTAGEGRSQGSLAGGGAAWEALVCWYLNFCLLGTSAIVFKKRSHVPVAIRQALTVTYANQPTNSESDLIAVSFPADPQFLAPHPGQMQRLLADLNRVTPTVISQASVAVLQCKTNWNDNAQIPMLWDMVYQGRHFEDNRVRVGANNYSPASFAAFRYGFVTVPTSRIERITPESVSVRRVAYLTGGNYWGRPGRGGIAHSLKEVFHGCRIGPPGGDLRGTLREALEHLDSTYSYMVS